MNDSVVSSLVKIMLIPGTFNMPHVGRILVK